MTLPSDYISIVRPSTLAEVVRSVVSVVKAGDPMAPVKVVVPSGAAGQSLSRRLGRTGGAVNVHCVTVANLAKSLVTTPDAPSRHLTADVKRELARLVAAEANPPLNSHGPAALVQPLVRVFDELRKRTDLEVEALADESSLNTELVRLYGRYRTVASVFNDPRDLVEAATECVDVDGPPVVAVISEPQTVYVNDFLSRLADNGRLRLVLLSSGHAELDEALRQSLSFAELPTPGALGDVKGLSLIRVAPDADTEVQLALARVLEEAAAGRPFHRMALLFGSASPYALVAQQQMNAASIPWTGVPAVRLDQGVAGRFANGTLRMIQSDFARSAVCEWLAATPLRDVDGNPIPAQHWVQIANRARVQFGVDSWRSRLTLLEADLAAGRPADRALAPAVASFREFLDDLFSWVAVAKATWSEWVNWLQSGIIRYLGSMTERDQWPQIEAQAAEDAVQCVQRLTRLDDLGTRIDLNVFAGAVEAELIAAQRRPPSAHGLFLGSVSEAVGLDFDFTVICGVAEGMLPARSGEGLLASLQAPGQESKVHQLKRDFLLAVGGGGSVELSCPAVDQRSQRPARPSPWLLDQASVLAGAYVSAEALMGEASWPWLERVPSFTTSLGRGDLGLRDQLDTLNALAANRAAQPPDLVDSFSVVERRRSASLTEVDGFVDQHPALVISPDEPLTPTSLEDWAKCPFRYFLKTVVGVGEQENPDDEFQLDARKRGSMVHLALERFVKETPQRQAPDEKWTDAERALLHSIGDELYEEARAAGRTPEGLLWDLERNSLHAHLDGFLERDEVLRAELGTTTPIDDVELAFGSGGKAPVSIERPGRQPVAFRGRIDRVDRSPDGRRAVAFDYKTGNSEKFRDIEKDPVANGSRLQLAVYAEAVRQTLAAGAEVKAGYWFLTDALNRYPLIKVEADEESTERWQSVIGNIADGVEAGVFPLVPGEEDRGSYRNCLYCPYDDLCPADRGEAWQRKAGDPAYLGYATATADVEGASS